LFAEKIYGSSYNLAAGEQQKSRREKFNFNVNILTSNALQKQQN
jgi:hypothetical protein